MAMGTNHKSLSSYGQILRSTAQIGGSTVVSIVFGIIRNKAIAVLLGPSGVGLAGLYTAIAEFSQNLAGLGISSSGVRQIAEAAGTEDNKRIELTATILRRTSLVLGAAGAMLLFLLAEPIAAFTFGSHQGAAGVALLSIAVLFRSVAGGQLALIQGLRRITDLAFVTMLSAFLSTVAGVLLIYLFREQGIVPSLIATAAISALMSWWYSRKASIGATKVGLSQLKPEVISLLQLGLAFMTSSLLMVGTAYAIRIIVLHYSGIVAAGFYQAAWTIGGLYTGFLLQSMSADFYPRLTAAANDDPECNRLVNEQAQISMLIAGPGVIATLTFAPLVMTVFYTAEFSSAITLLRWLCLGMMLRVVAWPMGFVILAKGARKAFFWTEVAAAIVHVGVAWPLVAYTDVNGAGIAFLVLYIWHSILVYLIARRLSGFRWSAENRTLGLVFLPLAGAVFLGFYILPFWIAMTAGLIAMAGSALYSLRTLLAIASPEILPSSLRPLLARFI